LVCRLRVKISPVYSVPVFLKVPMLAMIFLRFALFRALVLAASMAIDGPKATDGAPPPLWGLDSTGGTFLSREE